MRAQAKPNSVASLPLILGQLISENKVLRWRLYSLSELVKCRQVIAARSLITVIVKAAQKAAGQLGVKKTVDRIRDNFHRVGLEADI